MYGPGKILPHQFLAQTISFHHIFNFSCSIPLPLFIISFLIFQIHTNLSHSPIKIPSPSPQIPANCPNPSVPLLCLHSLITFPFQLAHFTPVSMVGSYKGEIINDYFLLVHFQSMDAYKTNLLPTFVLYKSPDFLRYIEEAEIFTEKPLEVALTRDHDTQKKQQFPEANQPMSANTGTQKKYLKDDYQKNITINVVKCCIREMLSRNYEKILRKRCDRRRIAYEQLMKFIEPILKEVVISLGDLKKLLTSGDEEELRLKSVFGWFLEWYLRHKYMYYLLNEGKMNFKERYIEYKNKYILYLLQMIRQERLAAGRGDSSSAT